ncbi:TAXI family TRAP transporter solute-binding subunit [Massilia sp. YIM B02763]|uniref:TAXI family TRAP transporter solute-binding subunit n=1 Tax=Massilia sp. YIM B02763 TaxID=3050130 RepID=UPI0025B6EDEE|nr:TAXI family TRAP transporter solute-binding subunit [Massilia sp. YIM B02763]MDN4053467.1 TAXI family TRAP transporter solute-binding subunit [Massilia sp. YIM B02763]
MNRRVLRKFSLVSLRDLLAASAPTIVLVLAACVAAYIVVDPAPPRRVLLSTGQENSAYEEFGKKYAAILRRDDIQVTLERSLGSEQNLQRLVDGQADVAFVQSGSASEDDAQQRGLVSLGSLFTEPVWLFLRDGAGKDGAGKDGAGKGKQGEKSGGVQRLTDLKGLRINLGPEGTGVPKLFRQVLAVNGLEAKDLRVSSLENTPATMELLAGRIDGLVFSSAPEAPLIQMLLQTPGIRLFDFRQAEAYTRRLPFLTHVVLPRGIVDLGRDIPSQDFHLIAPTATLVAREDLHPALVDLFVKAAIDTHGGAGWFQQQGQFPSPRYTEIPVAKEAAKYYKDGPPFLQRYLSFWLANLFDRLWVVVVALAALIIPLSKIVPPLYVWRIRSRVYRWYGQLRAVEGELEQVPADAPAAQREQVRGNLLRRLDEIEERVNHISIPLAYADALYGLRSHINFVRQRVQA